MTLVIIGMRNSTHCLTAIHSTLFLVMMQGFLKCITEMRIIFGEDLEFGLLGWFPAAEICFPTETNRTLFALLCMQNRAFGSYLPIIGVFISVTMAQSLRDCHK
jgi:hypothetical protein